jgi:hypothetical protein
LHKRSQRMRITRHGVASPAIPRRPVRGHSSDKRRRVGGSGPSPQPDLLEGDVGCMPVAARSPHGDLGRVVGVEVPGGVAARPPPSSTRQAPLPSKRAFGGRPVSSAARLAATPSPQNVTTLSAQAAQSVSWSRVKGALRETVLVDAAGVHAGPAATNVPAVAADRGDHAVQDVVAVWNLLVGRRPPHR